MAFLRMELRRFGAKSRYHFTVFQNSSRGNVETWVIAITMHLRSPSSEWELCPPRVKLDRCEAPIVLARARNG
eukprot:507613-Lingulodinium_polyedra.AAC.1